MATDPNIPEKTSRDRMGKVFLGLWMGCVSVLLTLLMSSHVVPFAAAPALDRAALVAHRLNQSDKGWQLLHVVAEKCNCSSDVMTYLLSRGPSKEVAGEGVVLVGHRPDLESQFKAAGFHYQEMAPASVFENTGLEAAPTLVVVDDAGNIRYTGGYYQRRERTEALDLAILARVRQGKAVSRLPSFGCAFTKRLQAAVDPLGLKYSRTEEVEP